jgi:hypothetical protein
MDMAERMARVETEITNLKDTNTSEHAALRDIVEKFIDGADKKYASKITEKVVFGMIAFVLVSFGGAIVTLILK